MPETQQFDASELRKGFQQARNVERIARVSVAAGGRILRDKARALAQDHGLRRTGALIANIVIKRERNAPPGTSEYHLGVRHGQSMTKGQKAAGKRLKVNGKGRIVTEYTNDPWYWRFPEFGTKHQPKQSFIAAALDTDAPAALTAMAQAARRALTREARA